MTKRKGKASPKADDSLLLLETPSVPPAKGFKEFTVPAIVFFIFLVGGLTAVWFCSQQQQSIDSLTESVNAMQLRMTKLQQQLGMGNAQIANVGVFEERLQALEEAYTQAQKKADVALATTEKLKSTDLQNQVWSLQSDVNARLSGLQQELASTASLNAVVKNKTGEIESLKERLTSILSTNSEVAVTISGLTDTVLVTQSRLDEHASTVERLTSELEEQRMELINLKETFENNLKALQRSRQEVMDIKDLLQTEQVKSSQALEEQLMAVRSSLEDHQKSTHSLHSHMAAQLGTVQTQFSDEQEPIAEEEIPVDEQEVRTREEVEVQTVFKEEAVPKEEQFLLEEEDPEDQVQVHDAEIADAIEDNTEDVEEQMENTDVPIQQEEILEDEQQNEEILEELDRDETKSVTEDEVTPEETDGKDEDIIYEEEATEEEATTEEFDGKDLAVIDEESIIQENDAQEEADLDEQIGKGLAEELEETEINPNVIDAVENISEDPIEIISQEEGRQKPLDRLEVEDLLEPQVEDEPADDFDDFFDEKDI